MEMNPDEKGFVLPVALLLAFFIFSSLLFSLYIYYKSARLAVLDLHHLQLNYKVEGGLYLALESIRTGNTPEPEQTIYVEGTPIKITLRKNDERTIELFGYGEMPPDYASGIAMIINKETGKIIEWRDGG